MSTGLRETAAREFEAHRDFLWGFCYRMTGGAADADELVQQTFVRALERPPSRPDGWPSLLVRTAAGLSVDALRRRQRRHYVGPWLPSPVETGDEAALPDARLRDDESAGPRYDRIESLSIAFLRALEALSARERAVIILRDVFDHTVADTAKALDLTQATVKLALRHARTVMAPYDASRVRPTRDVQARTAERLSEFLSYLQRQDVTAVEAMLSPKAAAINDGGGEFVAALAPVTGKGRVVRLLLKLAAKSAAPTRFAFRMLNGLPALLVESPAPEKWAQRFVFRIEIAPDGLITEVHTILATRKLAAVRFGPA